ncbi:MAG: V-type ATP synthase subunit D [Candidatus Hodarchaeota archaeon]
MSKETSTEGVKATRMELLALKDRLALAEKGHALLQEKLEALTNELFSALSTYRTIRTKTIESIENAKIAYSETKMIMGSTEVRDLSLGIPRTISVTTSTKNLMGVSVPIIQINNQVEEKLSYSLHGTSVKLDEAIEILRNAITMLLKLAEIQATISRLAKEISNTRRRVNALNFIVIPHLKNSLSQISLILAEREREEFTRLKKIKKRLEAQASI